MRRLLNMLFGEPPKRLWKRLRWAFSCAAATLLPMPVLVLTDQDSRLLQFGRTTAYRLMDFCAKLLKWESRILLMTLPTIANPRVFVRRKRLRPPQSIDAANYATIPMNRLDTVLTATETHR